MEHISAHAYKLASPCCSQWRDQWPWSLTQLNLHLAPRQNRQQAHPLWKPSANCWRVVNQVLNFVFLCDDHLLHPKNTAESRSAKENHKKIKQELLKGRKPGQCFVLLPDNSLFHPQNHSRTPSTKENHKIKRELLKNSKRGWYFVASHDDHLLHPKHSHILQCTGKPWHTIEKTGGHVNIHIPFIMLIVVLLFTVCSWELRTMPCEWLWPWRNVLQWWYHVPKRELLVMDSTSKRPWGLLMMGRHTTTFEWVLPACALISRSWL